MNASDTIQTWRWRIVKAKHTASSFGELVGVAPSTLSDYFKVTRKPSLERFDMIEDALREMGV